MLRSWIAFGPAVLFLWASSAAAQVVGGVVAPISPMPRDRAPVVREGTAVLKGRVIDGATGAAIRRARVRIMGPAGPRPSALTDDSGSFSFAKLPAGPYMLMVEKATYLPIRHPEPGRTLRQRMQPIVVREGESSATVTVPMYRGGAITGRVLDAHGDPLDHAFVQVLRIPPSGRGRPMPRGSSSTNDIGEFRIGRLEPGSYLLLASARRMERDEPSGAGQPPVQPLPTYYPGVPAVEQAQPIAIERGQSIVGIELVLAEAVPTTVTGTVVTTDGQPVTANAYVNARPPHSFGGMDAGGGSVRPDGTFRLQLAPGDYVIEARATSHGPGNQARMSSEQFGSTRLTVGSTPIDSVMIVIGNGATATGRIIFEGTTPPPPPGNPVHVPLNSSGEGTMCRSGQAQVNADWTFRVEGLIGTCSAPWQPSFGRWTLKSVLVNGEDLLSRTVTFEPGQRLRNVQIVFTDRRTSMTFHVADESGQRTREYAAVVFSTDKSHWTQARFVRTYVPPQQASVGAFVMPGNAPASVPATPTMPRVRPETLVALAPGEYYVVAVEDLEAEDVRVPEVLEQLIPAAVRVTVSEGSTTEVALRRVKDIRRR